MGSRHSVNEGIGKEFDRTGNSVKRFRPFSESPDSKKLKFSALTPFPSLCSYRWSQFCRWMGVLWIVVVDCLQRHRRLIRKQRPALLRRANTDKALIDRLQS